MMLNMDLCFEDGRIIRPNYMDKDERKELKLEIGNRRECMWCSCRSDTKLYYLISESLAFYPAHKNYQHAKNCSRYYEKGERVSAYQADENKNTATIFLKFNPKDFSIPTQKTNIGENEQDETREESMNENLDGEQDIIEETEEGLLPKAEEFKNNEVVKEFSLEDMIRCINVDTFNERQSKGSKVLNQDMFAGAIFGRLKYLHIGGMKKAIRDYTLEDDGFRFFYSKFSRYETTERNGRTSNYVVIEGKDGCKFNLFIFSKIYERAAKKYYKRYGMEPSNLDTMIAGFQYLKTSRKGTKYKVLGRIQLFRVNDQGIYCRTTQEVNLYNEIISYALQHEDVNVYIPVDDSIVGAVYEIKNIRRKILFIFPTIKSTELPDYNLDVYRLVIFDKSTILDAYMLDNIIESVANE